MELKSLQSLRTPRVGAFPVAVLTGLLVACSSSGPQQDSQSDSTPVPVASPESTPPAAETAPVPDEAPAAGESMAESQDAAAQSSDTGPVLSPTAPQTYTVKQGDTLWDIASTFLRDPWFWPEIWYVNPQVENPHLIYPGDVLALAYGADGRPQVRLERGGATRLSPRVRSHPLEGAVQAIPYEIIAAFMSKPTVLEKNQIRSAPHIVSSREQHLVMASGNTVYARGDLSEEVNTRYNVIRVGEPLVDPDDNDVVGYEGIYTGTARLTRPGDPASLVLTESTRETFDGDRLLPGDSDIAQDFIPRAPDSPVDGRIISIVDGISIVGQYQVVVINRGQRHGLQQGHVLSIEQVGPVVRDKMSGMFGEKVRLPNEPAGTFMVFKTFDRISYGLIMEAQSQIRVLDRVVNP